MDCSHARDLLAPEPGPSEASPEIEAALAHYEQCGECQSLFERHRQVAARVRTIAAAERAPAGLHAKILAAIREPQAQPAVRAHIPVRIRARRWAMGALAAAAALTLWIATRDQSSPSLMPLVEQVMSPSAETITGSELAPIEEWFATRAVAQFQVPDISNARVTGGRVTYIYGMPSPAVEYTVEGTPLTYVVLDRTALRNLNRSVGDDEIVTSSADGYEVAMWMEGGSARAVLSSLSRERLEAIAEECKAMAALQ